MEHLSWHWIFWTASVLTPIMMVCTYFGVPPQDEGPRPSWRGFLLHERRTEPDLWRARSRPALELVEFRNIRRHADRRYSAAARLVGTAIFSTESAGQLALSQCAQHCDSWVRRIHHPVRPARSHWQVSQDSWAAFSNTGRSRPAQLWPGSRRLNSFSSGLPPSPPRLSSLASSWLRDLRLSPSLLDGRACRFLLGGRKLLRSRTHAGHRHCRRICRPGGEPSPARGRNGRDLRTLRTPPLTRLGCTPCD